ncbi:hypothetical protein BV898_11037 [Hypsibius exemplaris]|uniref:Uncharacterized protein n=1 Tax=Hypsibius exemplaris TaxID=2072580 RepID=A0A1W0WHU1_HYPEX|nr:hypothetical protein BV898_11037 [Hypsibius exemplaris]
MTDTVWKQTSVPVNRGCLGIRRTKGLSFPTFLASVYSVHHLILLIDLTVDLDAITEHASHQWCAATNNPPPAQLIIQKLWDRPIVERASRDVVTAAGDMSRARLLAVGVGRRLTERSPCI